MVFTSLSLKLCRLSEDDGILSSDSLVIHELVNKILVGSLSISYGHLRPSKPKAFSLHAPACVSNFYRIARLVSSSFEFMNLLFVRT